MLTPPRWDGRRLTFEFAAADGASVRCAITRPALLAVSGGGAFHAADMLRRFEATRPRIEAAVKAKLSERSTPPLGILHVWEEEILDAVPSADGEAPAAPRD